jgi:excisionase family DNA binding protein
MGKTHAEFSVGKLAAASHRNADADLGSEAPGTIPSWASQAFDLNEPSDPAPAPSTSCCSSKSADAGATRAFIHLMTVAEVATALRVSTKTIRRMIARGELQHVKLGRLIRVRAEDIVQHLGGHASASLY